MAEKFSEDIVIYNTINRRKEKFDPVTPNKVSIYACGPTVYSFIHIGNARPLIFFDVIRRYFQYRGYAVNFVQNITDVDDKIIARALEENTSTDEIAKRYIEHFRNDCKALGVLPPDAIPKASEYINPMVALIKKLIDNGYAYVAGGNVFFESAKDHQYGTLSGKDLHHMEIGERVSEDVQQLKKDPRDFSLWKPAQPGEPSWKSPWGPGRPGWHTECVAMSIKELGKEFDIHAGGIDLIFPHHENEYAQARCGENAKFARYWMHNEFVNMKDRKMAKSEGNVMLVHELTKKYKAEAIRLFFLQSHYRKQVTFEEKLIKSAESAVERIYRVMQNAESLINNSVDHGFESKYKDSISGHVLECKNSVVEAMNNDFNTPQAVGAVFTLIDEMNAVMERSYSDDDIATVWKGQELLHVLNGIFGIIPVIVRDIDPGSIEGLNLKRDVLRKENNLDDKAIEELIEKRTVFRSERNWVEADAIRKKLLEMGIIVEDKKEGTRWWRKGKTD